ncbi:membrane protein [Salmonella enterica subsp. enterica]|uniref:Membrane protein n=1 Tax=Salmonella enterica I TaxID=59201 RepID=A0A447TTQ5_SALET|nr:membrane protein [Salmonella enterica subsp. enterica]
MVCLATIALSSMLLLTVVSFKQRALWGWLGLIFVVVLAMSGWLKWQVEAVEKWRLAELLWLYGLRLVLMAMLVLPWMQYQLHSQTGSARYPQFYLRLWHNVLTLFIVLVANGLFLAGASALERAIQAWWASAFSAPFSLKLKPLFM